MKNYKLFLTVIFFTFSQKSFCQIKLKFGGELGMNISGVPKSQKYIIATRNDVVKETNIPIVSPKIGGFARIEVGKHFYSNFGIQYYKVGNKYHYHRDGNDLLYNETFTRDEWENQKFNKLTFPISLGYSFKIRTRIFYTGVGLKLNYYTKGEYRKKVLFVEENHPSDIDKDETLNPFDKTQFSVAANKLNSGYILELGMNLNKKVIIELNYTNNQYNTFGNTYGCVRYYNNYSNGEISLMVKYTIK